MKTCRKCGAEFERDDCPECARLRAAKWYLGNKERAKAQSKKYREKNKEALRVTAAAWRANNQGKIKEANARLTNKRNENREQYLARQRKHYLDNKDRYKELAKKYQADHKEENREKATIRVAKWREKNREKAREASARWIAKHPEVKRRLDQNRRSRKRGSGQRLSKGLVEKLLVLQKNKCVVCRSSLGAGYHLDHMMPLVLKGKNEDQNMQLLCPSCNLSKHAKHPIDFMQSRGFLL